MQKTALEHDLHKLVEKALALGASCAKQLTLPVSGLGPGHAGSASLVALIMEKHCAVRHLFLIMRQRRGFTGIYQRDYHSVHFSFEWGGG